MKNLIKKQKGEFSFITWIKKRIKCNLNFLALFQGPTGIGKSWASLFMAYALDNDFSIDQVAFDFQGVMDIINSDWFKKKKLKVIVFDEAQIDISNREWQSLTNRLMNYLLSTFRHQNIILLFTSPYADFLDSHSRKLLHCIFDCRGTNRKKKTNKIRPLIQQYNPKKQKFYEHSLYVITPNGVEKLKYWDVPKPPKHLIQPYEDKKTAFTDQLNKEILDKLMESKKKDSIFTDTQEDYLKMYKEFNGDVKKVAEYFDTSIQNVYKHIRKAKMRELNQLNLKKEA